MNNETKTPTKDQSAKLSDLIRYVGRKIERTEGLIQDSMEDLSANFIMNFEWKSEVVYKWKTQARMPPETKVCLTP